MEESSAKYPPPLSLDEQLILLVPSVKESASSTQNRRIHLLLAPLDGSTCRVDVLGVM